VATYISTWQRRIILMNFLMQIQSCEIFMILKVALKILLGRK
jgi:hypothetical protein